MRKVSTVPEPVEEEPGKDDGEEPEASEDWEDIGEEGSPDGYKFVQVPPMEDSESQDGLLASVRQQVQELYNDFTLVVGDNEDAFRHFMLWAAETEEVNFQDLLVATRSLCEIQGRPFPGGKPLLKELKDMANLVEIMPVSHSELDYALEIFSKTFDLYQDELRRLEDERSMAEKLSSQKISEEILAEDKTLLSHQEAEAPEPEPAEDVAVESDRWEKVVDDTRSKINATKAEFDELMEELTPFKAERDAALSRLRVLEKDSNRKKARLEWFHRGRISEAKAEEITNLEREMERIEEELGEWTSRLGEAQVRIDASIDSCYMKREEFEHIRGEVESLMGSLPTEDREAVQSALRGELQDLENINREVDRWIRGLTINAEDVPTDPSAILDGVAPADGAPKGDLGRTLGEGELEAVEEPPIVFKDEEVKKLLSQVPIERAPEEELLVRIEGLQTELVNRENAILELEHTIEKLLEDKEGSSTAVELERNKIRLELAKTQEELTEKQQLLEQYLGVIKALEDQMEIKDVELKETLALNRRKTDELRNKERALSSIERELLEKQEEYKAERQELQDREARLNAQITEREAREREIAKKDLTLELRSEQIRKKMDRLTTRELELQRMMSQQKELEEIEALKERELQNLKAEQDVREEELRRREAAIEERSDEAKKLHSELSKLEHRLRSKEDAITHREAHFEEEDERIRRLEKALADREVQLQAHEEAIHLREVEADSSVEDLDRHRTEIEELRRELTADRQEVEKLRISQEHRHEELVRREDQLSAREATLRERDRATQLREERIALERKEVDGLKEEFDGIERRWSGKEKAMLEQLEAFNSEKQELLGDWKASRKRIRELEKEKSRFTARLLATETSLMEKDGELLTLARELEEARGRTAEDALVELNDGTRVPLGRIVEDLERQRSTFEDMDTRTVDLERKEIELAEMEELLSKERERLRELIAEQERGRAELQDALEHLTARTKEVEDAEAALAEREGALSALEEELQGREAASREREATLERVATAEGAEARAEEREEELVGLQRDYEERVTELERREEELQRRAAELEDSTEEVERQKRELLLARENLITAQTELEEVPPPEQPKAGPPQEPPEPFPVEELTPPTAPEEPPRSLKAKAAAAVEAAAAEEADKPLARLRCKVCGTVIPIFTEERPLQVVCPSCGKGGVLK